MSAGQIHNSLLAEYIDTYGVVADEQITAAEARADYLAIAQIAQGQGFDSPLAPEQEADALLAHAAESGFFGNGVLLSPADRVALAIQRIENPGTRAAFVQIADLAKKGAEGWVQESQQILALLTGLNQRDQGIVDGFGSVLGDSYVLWSGSLAQYRQNFVEVCDAIGYSVGKDAEYAYHINKADEYARFGMTYHPKNLHWAEKASAAR